MALARITLIDQIEFTSTGDVQIRLKLLIVDGNNEISSRFHRTLIPNGTPPAPQMAEVDKHLIFMGESPVDPVDLERLYALCDAERATTGRKSFARLLRDTKASKE